jgi:purine-binding chemotaxis protein CheW
MIATAKIMDSASKGTFADSAGVENRPSLQIFRRGSAHFALPIAEIAGIADWRPPTPLPQAPPAVLGVVSVGGRMLTVLDPAILLENPTAGSSPHNFIVALRGDEQLALLVDETGETLPAEIVSQSDAPNGALLGVIRHQESMIGVLDLTKLFALAIRGRERRQRRF